MKKESSDKSLLCIIGIFVCSLFIILPPVFRKAFPKEETVTVESNYRQMNCSSPDNGEIIVVNYKGKDSQIGQLKYTFVMDSETFRAKLLKTDMERSYNLSRKANEDNNTMTYVISPTSEGTDNVLDANDLLILSIELKQSPNDQKVYYEKLGFTCSLADL
jgi:hypothetical protein